METKKETENSAAPEVDLRRHYERFISLYRGRKDVVALHSKGEYVPLEGEGLTFGRFLEHLRMEKTYAVYNRDDEGKVGFGLFDVDVDQRDKGWDSVLPRLEAKRRDTALIMQTLFEMGLERKNLLLEFPTVGFHLFIFFEQPVPAVSLKKFMKLVVDRSGAKGVPFYPRKTDGAPWGDRVQLPLRINRNTSKRSNFIRDLETFDPENYNNEPDFSPLHEVVPVAPAWLERTLEKYGGQ